MSVETQVVCECCYSAVGQFLEELSPSFFSMMRIYTSQIFDKYVPFPSLFVCDLTNKELIKVIKTI